MSGNSSVESDEDDLEMLRSAALKTLKSRQAAEKNNQIDSQVNLECQKDQQRVFANDGSDISDRDIDELDAEVNKINKNTEFSIIEQNSVSLRPSSVDLLISEIENELEKLNTPIELKYEHIETGVEENSQISKTEIQKNENVNIDVNGNQNENRSEEPLQSQTQSKIIENDLMKYRSKKTMKSDRKCSGQEGKRSRSRSESPEYGRLSMRQQLPSRTSNRLTKQCRQKIPIVVNPISLRPLSPRSAAFVSENREIVARRIRPHSSSQSRSRSRSRSQSTESTMSSNSSERRSRSRSRSSSIPLKSYRNQYNRKLTIRKSRSPVTAQLIKPKTAQKNDELNVTSTDKNNQVFEERRRRFRKSPITVTAKKVIKLQEFEPNVTKKTDENVELTQSRQETSKVVAFDRSAIALNILLSDEDDEIFKVEENEVRIKSSVPALKVPLPSVSKVHVSSASISPPSLSQLNKLSRSVTVTSKATNTCTTTSAISDPVSDHNNRRNILLPPKKMGSIVAQVKPIKKLVRKHTPIVFKNDEKSDSKPKPTLTTTTIIKTTPFISSAVTAAAVPFSALRSASSTSASLVPSICSLNSIEPNPKSSSFVRTIANSAPVSTVRNVKKISDPIDSETNVIDLRLELKRKRAVKLNRLMERKAHNFDAEASSSLEGNSKKQKRTLEKEAAQKLIQKYLK